MMDEKTMVKEREVVVEDECSDHCCYKIGVTGDLILCCRCGRIRALKGDTWKILF